MADTKLSTPRVRVVRGDGTEHDLQATNADLVLWDMTRVKHRWPKFDEAPFLWMTFVSWAAARRTKVVTPDVTFESWREDVLSVEPLDDDGDEDELGRPFDPAIEPV